jgi:hypothetical protein
MCTHRLATWFNNTAVERRYAVRDIQVSLLTRLNSAPLNIPSDNLIDTLVAFLSNHRFEYNSQLSYV